MKIMKRLVALGAVLGGLSAAVSPSPAQNWTRTSAPITNWSCVASSADGTRLVAAVNGGLIYTSTDSGATWMATSAPGSNWASLACSADGSKLVAASLRPSGERAVYRSSDSGTNWAVALAEGWGLVVSSADGTVLSAIPPYAAGVAVSTNSGATWTAIYPIVPAFESFWLVACSANGKTLVLAGPLTAAFPPMSIVDIRTNSGTALYQTGGSGGYGDCAAVACSADGTKLLALLNDPSSANCPGKLYWSWDSGLTWTSNCAPVGTWTSLACSADGTRLVAVAPGEAIYTTTNAGAAWRAAAVPYGKWSSVASSADGTKLVAVVQDGGIWTWQTTPAPILALASSGGELVLSWTVPSMNFALQQNADLNTTNWTDVPGQPVLDYSTLRNQVATAAPPGTMFYRLVSR
jgi:hypothetical protein